MTPQAKELVSILEHAKDLMNISREASVRYINEAIFKIVNNYVIMLIKLKYD